MPRQGGNGLAFGLVVAPLDPDEAARRDAMMQRVRVGVTGLAAVFLLTLLAASLLSLFGQDRGPGKPSPAASAESPREPLAELGVAPGPAAKPEEPAHPAPATARPAH